MIHCAGLSDHISFETSTNYRSQSDFKKLNKDVQTTYNAIANRFASKSVTGAIIRKIILFFCRNSDPFTFWHNIWKQTRELQSHSSHHIWLLPPTTQCQQCKQFASLKKIRKTNIITTNNGVLTAYELNYACKRKNCHLKDKNINYNGWIDASNEENHWGNTINGSHRLNIFARYINKFVCFMSVVCHHICYFQTYLPL